VISPCRRRSAGQDPPRSDRRRDWRAPQFSVGEAAGRLQGESSTDDLVSLALDEPSEVSPPPIALGDWLLRGAYPEVRINPEVGRGIWCASYIQSYLERDARQITPVGHRDTFGRSSPLAAARTGQILNHSELARDAGVSAPTARQWISILEASGPVFLLQPLFRLRSHTQPIRWPTRRP
jgi:hypothetical protein